MFSLNTQCTRAFNWHYIPDRYICKNFATKKISKNHISDLEDFLFSGGKV